MNAKHFWQFKNARVLHTVTQFFAFFTAAIVHCYNKRISQIICYVYIDLYMLSPLSSSALKNAAMQSCSDTAGPQKKERNQFQTHQNQLSCVT